MPKRKKLIIVPAVLAIVIALAMFPLRRPPLYSYEDIDDLPQNFYIYDVFYHGGRTYAFCSENSNWRSGPRYILQEGSSQAMVYHFSDMAWWENGEKFIYTSGRSLYTCTIDGKNDTLLHIFGSWFDPSIAGVFGDFAILTSEYNVAMVDLSTGETKMVIIPHGSYDRYLTWDGEWIYFSNFLEWPLTGSGSDSDTEYIRIGRFSTVTGEDDIIDSPNIAGSQIQDFCVASGGYLYFQYGKEGQDVARLSRSGGIADSLDIPFSDYGIRGPVDILGYQDKIYISAMHRNEAGGGSVNVYLLDGSSCDLKEILSLPVEGAYDTYAAASISSGVFAAVFDDGNFVSGSIA